jgi:hypothetical protein
VQEDLPLPPAPDIVGFVDGIVRGRLCGWAYDRADPLRRLTVGVWDRTGREMAALADRYRADVHQSGHGDGCYGFAVPMGQLSEVEAVRVVSIRPTVELTYASAAPGVAAAEPHIFSVGSYTLQIDAPARRGQLSGWAVDTLRPQFRRALQLHVDGRLIGRQRATLYRAEVVDGVCDEYHGFLFALPAHSIASLILEDVGMGAIFRIQP